MQIATFLQRFFEKNHAWRRRCVRALFILSFAWVAYIAIANLAVVYCDKTAARDPETGICVGAEERTLGPEKAQRAVLFVHGFVGGSDNFANMPDNLAAQGWRVRAMRLPGHGTSPSDFAKVPVDELLDAVLGEFDALAASYAEVSLVGHSMGGTLCTLAAAQRPVKKLVLAAPYFGVTYHWYYVLPVEIWAKLSAPVVPWLYKGELFLQLNRAEAKPEVFSYRWIPARGTRTLLAVGERANRSEVLHAVTCPVLLLHGPGDVAASFAAAQDAVGAMGSIDKKVVALPRSNHHIFWDYDRELVWRAMEQFLNE